MGKRIKELAKKVDASKKYALSDAVNLVKDLAKAKFDESVLLTIKLGVDVKQSNQAVRSSVVLPHGTGKIPKVLVFAKGEKEKEALEAKADFVGAEDMVEKVMGGWRDFDVVIATPDMMRDIGKLGKVLGPSGLMPNPKSGTVTNDLARSVKEAKTGRIEFKSDVGGVVHSIIGKASFDAQKLLDNANTLMEAVIKVRPQGVKGVFVQKVVLHSTMSPAVNIDTKPYLSV
ncbi:MAG: 50S ribosomal protein L1 [Candidatus Firestonebacteria bacterium RIFOXYC2_FULL_39_67]|nr:MAG: 50S ribosomal protein L1 [Candidatus Firestonebacteria bacterium RIFOXYD2_FULL_39_29]OGF54631.1 MAG: 50S ribosomal protein L1 [Candidatus Firestonebacteria bacterium RifOxyC12_full_39_7]OGF57229.1 MAG: 50S ribosomal protein L1 [Candidatus Firestonebacteria bacterium RIFOXYC2_FULL_39_67]